MATEDMPTEVVRDLIKLLFDDCTPSSRDTFLLVNPTPAIAKALETYYSAEITASDPETTVIHSPEVEPTGFDWTEFADRSLTVDFINSHEDFGDRFDFIICLPRNFDLETLSLEEQKELATQYASLTVESETANSSALHFEQILKYLGTKGRGTLLAGPEFNVDEDFGMLGDLLYFTIDNIDVYNPDDIDGLSEPRAATLVTSREHEASHTGFSYNPEYFESLLGQQVASDRPFEVAAIMTDDPLSYGANEIAWEIYFDLHYRDFDAALVFENPDEREGLCGYVSRQRLRSGDGEKLSEQSQEIDERILLHPRAGIPEVIEALSTDRFRFVGSVENVQGIVTRFDLNRLPVFLHLFDRFSEFEVGLRNLVREELPDWEEKTSIYVSSPGSDELYADKLAGASLRNLVDIVEEAELETEIRRDIHGYDETLGDLVDLRNMVAHYNPIIHTMGGKSQYGDERDAAQLCGEYRLLTDAIQGLYGS